MKSPAPLVLSCAFVLACGGSGRDAPAGDAGTDAAQTASSILKFSMNVKVPPHKEVHRCELIKMPPGDGEIFVGARKHKYTPGSHHYLVFRTSLADIPKDLAKQVDCFEGDGVMKYSRGYVAGGQTPEANEVFPEGVAFAFKAGEVLLFQAHYVNAGPTELDATVDLEWTTVPKEKVVHRASVTNFYNPFIFVPAKGEGRAPMSCPFTKDVTILGAGPHMHKRGVFYQAFVDEPGKPPSTTPFYTTDDWEHPKPYVGPMQVKAGTRVRFECKYKNPDDRTYIQGQSADDNEMCMFSAIYYPEMPIEENQCRTGMSHHGVGTMTCAQLTKCTQDCPPESRPTPGVFPPNIGECVQKCVVDSCPTASGPFVQQLLCMQKSCAEPCKAGSDACVDCMKQKCLTEAMACQLHACE